MSQSKQYAQTLQLPNKSKAKKVEPVLPAQDEESVSNLDNLNNDSHHLDNRQESCSDDQDCTDPIFEKDDENEEDEEDDSIQKLIQKAQQTATNVHDFYFKFRVFFKFYSVHFIYYCILGPLTPILSPIFGYKWLYNQQFIGKAQLVQAVNYFCLVGFMLAYYMLDIKGLHYMEVYMLIITTLIRILTISIKYGYASDSVLKLMTLKKLSDLDLKRDLILQGWRLQSDNIIEQEVQAALLRLDVDSSLFFFEFVGQDSYPELVQKFKKQEILSEKVEQIKRNATRADDEAERKLTSFHKKREVTHNQWFNLIEMVNRNQAKSKQSTTLTKLEQEQQTIDMATLFMQKQESAAKKRWKESVAKIKKIKKEEKMQNQPSSLQTQITVGGRETPINTNAKTPENQQTHIQDDFVDFTPVDDLEVGFDLKIREDKQKDTKKQEEQQSKKSTNEKGSKGKDSTSKLHTAKSAPEFNQITQDKDSKEKQQTDFVQRQTFKKFAIFFANKPLQKKKLFGYNILLDMLKHARTNRSTFPYLIFGVAILRCFIPSFYRLYEGFPFFTETTIVGIIPIPVNFFFFAANTFILIILVLDLNMRTYCLKQIGYLISPKKIVSFREKKLYPTLNIFDPVSLKTWANLRRTIFDYGNRYVIRNSLNLTLIMIFYFILLMILILQTLGIIKAYDDPLLQIIFAYETLFYFILFTKMLFGAAFINDQYRVHKNLLKKNKTIIADFHQLTDLYVGKKAIFPDNPVYREGLRILKEELGEQNFARKLRARAETLMEIIDNIIEDLDFEEINSPMKIMGVPVTYNIIGSLGVGVGSVIFAIVQSLVSN